MTKTLSKTLGLVFLFLWASSFLYASESSKPLEVSMVSLLANPDQYEGRKVYISGYLHVEFEGTAIYLHQDDYLHFIGKNGFWVFLPENIDSLSGINNDCESDRYVGIVGTFTSKFQGHMGGWSGSIENVEHCRNLLRTK